jgi:hypothetical protein
MHRVEDEEYNNNRVHATSNLLQGLDGKPPLGDSSCATHNGVSHSIGQRHKLIRHQ